ncbi:hypothetical protein MIND_00265600 [Mycena indigotica]|uniref:Hemerythrin-like domain-containing protein n=1 Tax=Mycena indigotica TaxID=2126181 RepID=A0A8H6WHI8_9AGAR|nr:uncharacterized protein MIND_00265600 [Mycena indigotica]KAF7312519.1 hypothetical protein MIND_00265600 [Mycena indigotica]
MQPPEMPYPFPLIALPPGDHKDVFDNQAIEMTIAHNSFIRGVNAIYTQAKGIGEAQVKPFVFFCVCFLEMLHHHHHIEETLIFPFLETKMGANAMAHNVQQHHAFLDGLEDLEEYIKAVQAGSAAYDGAKIVEKLDSFTEQLVEHLCEEIGTLESSKIRAALTKKDLKDLEAQLVKRIIKEVSLVTTLPLGLLCHDKASAPQRVHFTGYFPSLLSHSFPALPAPVLFLAKRVFFHLHSDAWAFAPCDIHDFSLFDVQKSRLSMNRCVLDLLVDLQETREWLSGISAGTSIFGRSARLPSGKTRLRFAALSHASPFCASPRCADWQYIKAGPNALGILDFNFTSDNMPYPFPLVARPAGDWKNVFDNVAIEMSIAHNMVIRGINAIYTQAKDIPQDKVKPFVFFCIAVFDSLHHHHHMEETLTFPFLETKLGAGSMGDNKEQHKAFLGGLDELDVYLKAVKAGTARYDGAQIIAKLDTFVEALVEHLHEEIDTLESGKMRAAFTEKELKDFAAQFVNTIRRDFSLTVDGPLALALHEKASAPHFPPMPAPVLWGIHYGLYHLHSDAWAFGPCDANGVLKPNMGNVSLALS